MKAGAFVDSGAFIAFLDRSDASHADAVALFARPPKRWHTSVLVVSETYSWFLHRLGEETARVFARFLGEIKSLELLAADAAHHAAVLAKLEVLRGTKLSYVDASALVLVERLGIDTVWGTDYDLAVEGARVIPGPPVR